MLNSAIFWLKELCNAYKSLFSQSDELNLYKAHQIMLKIIFMISWASLLLNLYEKLKAMLT